MNQNLENNPDQISSNQGNLEAEIAWLTEQIEAKKELLTEKDKLPSADLDLERKLIKEVLQAETDIVGLPNNLDDQLNMTSESRQRIDDLIQMAKIKGFRPSLKEAKRESPLILDVFHDELTAYLQERLIN